MNAISIGAVLFIVYIGLYEVRSQTCPPGWAMQPGGSTCYMFASRTKAKSWADAQAACTGMKGTLLKINNTALWRWVQGEISKRIQSDPTTMEWWTSLRKISGTSWTWSDGIQINTGLGMWLSGEPNNAINPGCARVTQGRSTIGLSAASCAQEKAYVCQRPLSAPAYCDSDNGWESHNGNCYRFFDYRKQWADAKIDCENHGAVLARPMNNKDQRTVYDLAVGNQRDTWIGLTSAIQGGNIQWQWGNGSVISTSPYWKAQPTITSAQANNTCVVEQIGNGALTGWATKPCDEERQYICQKPEANCAPGWKGFGTMCYQFDARFQVSWTYAKKYCESQGGSMLEIPSADVQQFVNGYLQELRESGLNYIWLGLKAPGRSTYSWNSGTRMTYTNWQNAPRTSSYTRCAYIYTSNTRGQWVYGSYCTQSKGVACQIPSTTGVLPVTTPTPRYLCERGWSMYSSRINRCFKFNSTTLVNWADARAGCKQVGGDLVKIDSSSIQGYLSRYIRGMMWIGLSDIGVEGTFNWPDASQVTYTNWYGHDVTKLNSDSKDCVTVLYDQNRRGAWKPIDCSDVNGFICEKPALNAPKPTAGAATTPRPWSANCGPFWEELSSSGDCYQFHDEQKTYADAQAFCANTGGNLASISSVGEQNYVQGRIGSMRSVALWIGGNDLNVEGGWSWQDNSPFTYINWTPGEPNNDEDKEDCVTIYSRKGTWNDFDCNTKNGFICKKTSRVTPSPPPTPKTTPVPAGMLLGCPYGWLSFNSQCYKINKGTKTWSQALSACRQSGGDLASITSLGEQDFLYSQARSVPGALWIGFSARRVQRYYQWSDGKKATYTHWARDEPNNSHDGAENCVTFNNLGAGYWSDTVCNLANVAGYICKKNPSTVSATTPPNYKIGCPANGVGYFNLCYLFVERKMTFSAAEGYCVQRGGHLMTVSDRFIQAFLTSELTQHNGMYWIGLKTYQTGYYYYYWNTKARVRFTNFDQAHTGRELASCISVKSQRPAGLWHNNPCTISLPFICETRRVGFTLPPPGQQTTLSNRCPYSYREYSGFCYRLMSTSTYWRKTWREARDYCRMYGGDLVSAHNSTEVIALKRYVFRYTRYSYWIGLNNLTGKGYTWSDGTGFTYSKWGSGEPNNFNKNEDCVEWDMPSNSWRDANCYVAKSFACQVKKGSVVVRPTQNPLSTTKPPVTCGTTRTARYWRYYKGACYFFNTRGQTWYQARDYCRTTVKGDLLSVHSADDSNFFISVLSTLVASVSWIGLNELSLSGYKWSDGSAVQYRNWAKNEPNDGFGGQKCVAINNNDGYWGDENCGMQYPFICKQPVGSTKPVTPAPTKPLPGNCRNGWINFGNKCYLIKDGYYNFNDSAKACKRYGKGFSLVSIANQNDQAFIYSLLQGKVRNYWIGLNQMQRRRVFVWLDNAPVSFTNWDYREPNGSSYYVPRQELCVEIRTNGNSAGKWADVKCLTRHGYICQGYKETNQPVQMTTAIPSWCKAGYAVFGQSCYKVVTTPMTWDAAATNCKNDGAHLVSIGDSFEQAHVQVMTYGQKLSFWTGMTDKKLKGVYRWSDNWPVLFVNWGRNEPTRMAGEGCVAMVVNGTWNDTKCSNKFGSVCEISHSTPPPHTTMVPGYCSNSTWTSHSRYCYYISSRSYNSWPEAQFYCKRIGMRLVTIHNSDDTGYLLQLIGQQTYRTNYYFWVGLTIGQNNGFEWSDTTSVKYTNWAQNEPSNGRYRNSEECVQIHPSTGEWYDTYCTTRRPFICMADMVFPTQPGTGPTPDPGHTTQNPPRTAPKGQSTKAPSHQTGNTQTPRGKTNQPPRSQPPRSQPHTKATGVSTQRPPSSSTRNPQHLNGNQPNKGGGLSGGGVAGVVIGVLLVLGIAALGLIFARRRGLISIGPNIFPGESFENALYKKSADDVNIQ